MQRTPARTFSRNRRRLGLFLAGALVAAPALSSCGKSGFDVSTDLPYVPANGANFREDAPIDVVGLVIVSAEDGSGTLIATFVNKTLEPATTPEIAPRDEVEVEGYEPFEMTSNEYVNLADETLDPIIVTGETVVSGASVPLVFTEGDIERTMWVPVVPNDETTTTLPLEHGEESGEESEEGTDTEEHFGESHDGAPNPWADLDRSADAAPEEPATVTPEPATPESETSTDAPTEG
ncbi:hypothetical protein [Nocardioides alkalitolerans]|uniref:hypothetical protein n=1 Tax=Nocardioides alkalitolerans TaxID=281714 RepID=UPI0003F6D0CE|nr:hypothetical protein [Nocardioides alkalitolerans]